MKRKLAVEELKKTFAVLNADVEELKNMTGESLTAFGVRSTIRTFSALMEGLLYQMRQVALDSCDSSNEIYNAEELMVLREKAVYLDNAGLIKLKASYENTLPMLLFTFNQFPKIHGANYIADTSVAGWESMKKLIDIRNRIVHPKSSSDLELSEFEWEKVTQGMDWFHNTLAEMYTKCEQADEYIRTHGKLSK